MTFLPTELRAALDSRFERTALTEAANAKFEKLSLLRSYAAAGKTLSADLPAWDPDEERRCGSFG